MITNNYYKLIFLFIYFCSFNFASAEEFLKEKYTYEAVPKGSEREDQKEFIEMEFIHFVERIFFTSTKVASDTQEIIKLEMLSDGSFLSGIKNIVDNQGKNIRIAKISRNNKKVYIERIIRGKKKIKEYMLPQDKPLAVDASLLILLRSFPFDKDISWKVFMVDFSQHNITVRVRQAGVEKVVVQAGEFECYRIEVIVNLFIYHPKIIYWITKKKPHFLVKHSGKRGPFTPSYITSLISVE